jgi:hypothetical protein
MINTTCGLSVEHPPGIAELVEDKEAPEVTIPPLRAPELLVGYPDWDQKIDMWSYGLIVSAYS